MRSRVPRAAGASDFALIVPGKALRIVAKLLANKSIERVTLRRSLTLLSIEAARFILVSKLIDQRFPDYTRLIPKPPGNTVKADRIKLLRALDRVAAVVDPWTTTRRCGAGPGPNRSRRCGWAPPTPTTPTTWSRPRWDCGRVAVQELSC